MIYTDMTYRAMDIAYRAHEGQRDRNGAPYIFHPYQVAQNMPEEITACAALLHDVVEDTDVTLEQLAEDFPPQVIEALRLLTHDDDTPYLDYVRALKDNPAARMVKLADLGHNSDEGRLRAGKMSDEKIAQLKKKYASARAVLNEDFKIIAVTDFKEGQESAEKAAQLAGCGADAVILRAKQLTDGEYRALALETQRLAQKKGRSVIWHAHADEGIKAGWPEIHLPLAEFKRIKEDPELNALLPKTVGVSVHSPEEAREAGEMGASYAVYGHIYPTNCKKGAAPRGTQALRLAVLEAGIPVYAIGGIGLWNIAEVRDTGCAGTCVMSAFMEAADPEIFCRELREAIE